MIRDYCETTIATDNSSELDLSGDGCLLQIRPLEVNRSLLMLEQPRIVVGRDDGCGVVIRDASVSRQHAVIERTEGCYTVTDLGSTNGTCVNEQRVRSALLQPGDRIRFGGYIFKFLSTNHIEMQYHEAVYGMMTRDALTGAWNKRSFLDVIEREFQRAVRRNCDLSLILFDIDYFKSVNDTHGHLVGDEVLQELSARIRASVADHDVFARWGGEEFAILLADVALPEAVDVAERCRLCIAATPFGTTAGELPVTISAGVAQVADLLRTSGTSAGHLIQLADSHLYEAKRNGRNRVSSPLHERSMPADVLP